MTTPEQVKSWAEEETKISKKMAQRKRPEENYVCQSVNSLRLLHLSLRKTILLSVCQCLSFNLSVCPFYVVLLSLCESLFYLQYVTNENALYNTFQKKSHQVISIRLCACSNWWTLEDGGGGGCAVEMGQNWICILPAIRTLKKGLTNTTPLRSLTFFAPHSSCPSVIGW